MEGLQRPKARKKSVKKKRENYQSLKIVQNVALCTSNKKKQNRHILSIVWLERSTKLY